MSFVYSDDETCCPSCTSFETDRTLVHDALEPRPASITEQVLVVYKFEALSHPSYPEVINYQYFWSLEKKINYNKR
ncbi:uncharacterized protein PV09_00956 [Verruconis gallopava]|uniref:Uncharacterized protein n=1 Tax=Verruconis gallopava TaxID=253628 RepID=A0A0D2ANG0_9PEZI|nr:uncharacterized protein PV09_00956 [Verruconis gallopava]KIW08010.1 hypothetical protein PV09_00956 [Verruconis gallopava]